MGLQFHSGLGAEGMDDDFRPETGSAVVNEDSAMANDLGQAGDGHVM